MLNNARRLPKLARIACCFASLLLVIGGLVGCGLKGSGQDEQAKYQAAKADYEAGKFAESEKALREIVKEDPKFVDARGTLALALAAQGDNNGAIEQYEAIVEINPEDDVSYYRMAGIERVVGQPQKSAAHLQKALELKPNEPSYADELARTKMSLGQYREAAALWGSLLKNKGVPTSSHKQILLLQAQAYQDAKDYKTAKKTLKKALELDPTDKALKERIKLFD